MTVRTWLENAAQDAERRGLSTLRPLLEALAYSTSALRTADWNADATGEDDKPDAIPSEGAGTQAHTGGASPGTA